MLVWEMGLPGEEGERRICYRYWYVHGIWGCCSRMDGDVSEVRDKVFPGWCFGFLSAFQSSI